MTLASGMELLVTTVQELSLARSINEVTRIVRTVARELTGADGATFVLRDGDKCFYADEDAISPLWKGSRFPMSICISGWVMLNRQSTIIEDIYTDDRIPIEAYRPTFVKSLAMVPIRTIDPIGAIGNYWANKHLPTTEELLLLQALADITAVSLINVDIVTELENKLRERSDMLRLHTLQNQRLADTWYMISHNLRAPLSNLQMLADMVNDCHDNEERVILIGKFDPVIKHLNETFEHLVEATQIRLNFSIQKENLSFQECFLKAIDLLRSDILQTNAEIYTDFSRATHILYSRKYLESILFNLLSNAIRYRSSERVPRIDVLTDIIDGSIILTVRDNGLGIDLTKNRDKIFKLHKTFHDNSDAKGFGLFITKSQIEMMGGKITVESTPDTSTVFIIHFTVQE